MKSRSFIVLGALAFASLPSAVITSRAAAQNLTFNTPDPTDASNHEGRKRQEHDVLLYGLMAGALFGLVESGQSGHGSIDSSVSKGLIDSPNAANSNTSSGGMTRDEPLPGGTPGPSQQSGSPSEAPEGSSIAMLAAGVVPISVLLIRKWRGGRRNPIGT